MKIINSLLILILLLNTSLFTLTAFASNNLYLSMPIWNTESIETNAEPIDNNKDDFLNLNCEAAILMEQNSGEILYEKNSHEQLRPASVTKIMSILLIMEALDRR